jgi:hypothetical protein
MDDGTDRAGEWAARVAKDVAPPPELRGRIAADLRAAGLIHAPASRPVSRAWLAIAAAVVMFAAGWGAATWAAGRPEPSAGGRYMLLLYGETSAASTEAARVREYTEWAREARRGGRRISGERLLDDALPVGTAGGGGLAPPLGFFIVEAPSLEAARALAEGHPHVRHGGTIVVRPIAPD